MSTAFWISSVVGVLVVGYVLHFCWRMGRAQRELDEMRQQLHRERLQLLRRLTRMQDS